MYVHSFRLYSSIGKITLSFEDIFDVLLLNMLEANNFIVLLNCRSIGKEACILMTLNLGNLI